MSIVQTFPGLAAGAPPRLTALDMRPWTDDTLVIREAEANEYRLPPRMDGWNVLDIGAHIGAFARACVERGAARVLAYEPDPANHALLARNLAGLVGVEARRAALYNGPRPPEGLGLVSAGPRLTARHHLAFGQGDPVEVVDADEAIRELGRVDLLKIDCEGSEYPILIYSNELPRVRRIAGEAHGRGEDPCTPSWLLGYLRQVGFEVEGRYVPGAGGCQAVFWARREGVL